MEEGETDKKRWRGDMERRRHGEKETWKEGKREGKRENPEQMYVLTWSRCVGQGTLQHLQR